MLPTRAATASTPPTVWPEAAPEDFLEELALEELALEELALELVLELALELDLATAEEEPEAELEAELEAAETDATMAAAAKTWEYNIVIEGLIDRR